MMLVSIFSKQSLPNWEDIFFLLLSQNRKINGEPHSFVETGIITRGHANARQESLHYNRAGI